MNDEITNTNQSCVMCQWYECDKPATLKIKRVSLCVCDEHYVANVLRFGCAFTAEPVNGKADELQSVNAALRAGQESLGEEFEAVWDANTGKLYEP